MPGELLGRVRGPAEASVIVEPPEEDGDERSQGGEEDDGHQCWQLVAPASLHGDPVAGHIGGRSSELLQQHCYRLIFESEL